MKDRTQIKPPKLDDIALFLAIADAGGLAGAETRTGTPLPTLSRRMAELERRLNTRLFERGQRGYTLTSEGRRFLRHADPLRTAQQALARFDQESVQNRPDVRITAGRWTTRYIARNLPSIWTDESIWRPALLASNANVDIARREADIGIRNRRPDQSWLAGRKLGTLHYAEFARSDAARGYVTLPEGAATTPSERWLRQEHPDEIIATASDARSACDLAVAGIGRVILPCFAGRDIALVQVSPVIDALTHEEWLVSHHDARHDPPVRAALDALVGLLSAQTRFRT